MQVWKPARLLQQHTIANEMCWKNLPEQSLHKFEALKVTKAPSRDRDRVTTTAAWAYIIYNEEHHSFRDEVPDSFADDLDVGIRQVSDGFHLTFHLRI